jgi:hypothetical protein
MIRLKQDHPLFGSVEFEVESLAPGSPIVRFVSGFDPADVIPVTVPQLVGIQGARSDGVIPFHRLGHYQLLAAFAAIEKAGLTPNLHEFSGSFNMRLVNPQGKSRPKTVRRASNHAFGTAIDLNAFASERVLNPPLATVFAEFGFLWGQAFSDPMHFEVSRWLGPDRKPVHVTLDGNPMAITADLVEGHTYVSIPEFRKALGARSGPNGSGFGLLTLLAERNRLRIEWDNVAKIANLIRVPKRNDVGHQKVS